MKQEDKDLLLKDLCARLPYNIKVKTPKGIGYIYAINTSQLTEVTVANDEQYWSEVLIINNCKPYLRPMSSMTEEERKEWLSLMRKEYREQYPHSAVDTSYYEYFPTIESFDYLNSHHFDYRGLIEKGLALKAPSDMYK